MPVAAVEQAIPRVVTGAWWHQGPVARPLVACPPTAFGPGRYHRTGEPGVWYASSTMLASWCELFRHFPDDGALDPFEVRRRSGRVRVHLRVLDLTDEAVRQRCGITEADLVGDDYQPGQRVAAAARAAGFDGVLAPSAGLPGERTLAIFYAAIDTVEEETSHVQRPPINLIRRLSDVRPVPTAAAAYAAFLARQAALPYAALKRRYGRRP